MFSTKKKEPTSFYFEKGQSRSTAYMHGWVCCIFFSKGGRRLVPIRKVPWGREFSDFLKTFPSHFYRGLCSCLWNAFHLPTSVICLQSHDVFRPLSVQIECPHIFFHRGSWTWTRPKWLQIDSFHLLLCLLDDSSLLTYTSSLRVSESIEKCLNYMVLWKCKRLARGLPCIWYHPRPFLRPSSYWLERSVSRLCHFRLLIQTL